MTSNHDNNHRLSDDPAPSIDEVVAFPMVEEVWGTIECYNCDYFGRMTGYIMPQNKKEINFKCPQCEALEVVVNPECR